MCFFLTTTLILSMSAGVATAAPIAATSTATAHDCLDTATSVVELLSLGLMKRDDNSNGTTINGGAGTHIDAKAAAAIAGGSAAILLLVLLLCWCGRRRDW
ncbi:hypothetical protein BJ170DRAFT_600196 [Xylariales sp. AK1849]|nr:hypothetical protein BJ170DRAFT_600196 [Xylariales sp. AK1849]